MAMPNMIARLRYKYLPDHVVGEILGKRWIDSAIPFSIMVLAFGLMAIFNPMFFTPASLIDVGQEMSEFGLIALAEAIVILSGGIDLSVGMIYALSIVVTLTCLNVLGASFLVAFLAALSVGALCGAINGLLIGYLRLRAFLTTLVMLVIYRSVYELIYPIVSDNIVLGTSDSSVWKLLSFGSIFGLPISIYVFAVIALGFHILLSRMRFGWQLQAVGGARRSAYNAGINVRRTLFLSYVISGLLCSVGAVLFSARVGSAGSGTGVGLEFAAITAAVLGGNSLGGGRGSVSKALMGVVIYLTINSAMIQRAVPGHTSALVLGCVLLCAVFIDIKWVKHKDKLLNSVYVSPTYFKLPPCPDADRDSGTVFAVNDRLAGSEAIGLGIIEGAEDPLIDRDDNVYFGSRHGDIYRFFAPDYKRWEIFAHIGGHPIGMNFDKDNNLVCCVANMGVFLVTPDKEVVKLTDETNRSTFSIIDNSKLRIPDDLDIAPDGRIFFSEATKRFGAADWALDALELRPNGRLICYDPRDKSTRTVLSNLIFPNGVAMTLDGESLVFSETWACRVSRYWFDGPHKGKLVRILENLPGMVDNINRASDGTFWAALVAMRSPAFDLAKEMPGFRRRMTRRMGSGNWMSANFNSGCVLKFTAEGEVLESLWDGKGENHAMVTSVKEHKGYLFIGGILNNRIGKWKIPGADPTWTGPRSYWGGR